MKQHTQGKWFIGEPHVDRGTILIGSDKDYICEVLSVPDDEADDNENYSQSGANAKLIAAAPELLEALQAFQEMFIHREGETKKNKIKTDMIKYCEEVKDALNKARQIIQKATN